MKLESLYIDDYKLLKDFSITFRKDVSILIGINGSGKSSILEAIAWIFRCAHLTFVEGKKENTPFNFEISYVVRLEKAWADTHSKRSEAGNSKRPDIDYVKVRITCERSVRSQFSIETENDTFTKEQLVSSYGIDKLLPQNIIVYYSGWYETMEFLCKEHENIYKERLRTIAKSTERGYEVLSALPMLYIQKFHFDILLASLLSYEYNVDLDRFFNALKITKPAESTIALSIKKREWEKGLDENSFWGAKGIIGYFLSLCRDQALSKYNYDEDKEVYTFIFNLEYWYKLREEYVEEKKLFYILHMLYSSDMLEGIQIFLTKDGVEISHKQLSEGEQQLITIRGINELLVESNTLLLFDEPDTYLHPSWQKNFIEGVSQIGEDSKTQFIITTHSPQLLSNADPEKAEVQIMEDGEVVKVTPKYYGKDISTILYEMMGVERRNKKVAKLLSNLFNEIEEENLEKAKAQFKVLYDLLGEDDPAIVRAKTQLDFLEESTNEANN